MVSDVLSIPGVIYEHGLNIIIFEKKTQFTQNEFDKKTLKDDFDILYANTENIHYFTNLDKINLILLKEEYNYYPIYQVKKKENSKNIDIDKVFKYLAEPNNIINHIYQYIKINYSQTNFEISKIDNAKTTFIKIEQYKMSKYFPTKQIIDKRNKCKYLVIQDKYLLPIKPSGALFWIPIEENYELYINDIDTTTNIIYDIYLKSNRDIKIP